MQNVFKLFGGRGIGSFSKHFERSLWKLTFLYVIILSIILFLSSSVLYSAFNSRLEHRYKNYNPASGTEINIRPFSPTQEELQEDLIISLVLVNGILLFAAAILSYWLARLTLEPLNESYINQKRFIADASHELRTPLSILKIDLENKLNSPEVKASDVLGFKSNLEEVDRMSKLVDDLLVISRLSDEETIFKKNKNLVDINYLLSEIVNRFKPLSSKNNVSITLSSNDKKIEILSDEDLLNKIITNLVKNAVIYNKEGGNVNIKTDVKSNNLYITIKDTGIGIEAADLRKIFERFYRTDKSRSRLTGGSGLGLSIVESSLKKLGGDIFVESKKDEGTIFTVKIPVK